MSKIERSVHKIANLYRVYERNESGVESALNIYRVRKRIKVAGKWTTRLRTFTSFEAAKAFAKEPLAAEYASDRNRDQFQEVLEKFFHFKQNEELRAPGTLDGYRSRARHLRFFHGFNMKTITPMVVDQWTNLMLDPSYRALQQSSRQNYEKEFILLSGILGFYREFMDDTYVIPLMKRHRKRLCPQAKATEEIRYLTTDQEAKFVGALERWPLIRDVAIFQLHTGARIGEAAALDFSAIEFSQGQVQIKQHLHWQRFKGGKTVLMSGTKAGPNRLIPLTPECEEMLLRRYARRCSSVVFECQKRKGFLHYRSIQCVYDRVFRDLGLNHSGTHTLRHTFAVRFLDHTKDIHALQKALGHTDLKTTMIYAKYTNESVRRAFQIFRGGREKHSDDVPQLVPINLGS